MTFRLMCECLCVAELMEKENCDPDFQPPKKKAKRTKVAIVSVLLKLKVQMRWQKLPKDTCLREYHLGYVRVALCSKQEMYW